MRGNGEEGHTCVSKGKIFVGVTGDANICCRLAKS